MWQKVKQRILLHPSFAPLPLFAKMVLLYSSIVFFILIAVSVITVTSIHYIINSSIKNDLEASAQQTTAYLDSYGTIDASVFVRSNLPHFITLQIYNGAGKLILDNFPTYTIKKLSDRYIDAAVRDDSALLPADVQGNEASEFSYYRKWESPDGKIYYLRFSRQPDKENDFITLLSKQLLASILICLILTIFTGMYLMKKSLAPLRIISDTVKKIEVTQLDNRITLANKKKNELSDLALTINQALDRIEYGYKQQQQFINDASHELRTPITVIAGYADLLDRWGKHDPDVLQESITAIKSETEYMRQLIERLLFFARTNSGTLKKHFMDIDASQLLEEVYAEIMLIDKSHDIVLTQNDSAVIVAEPGSVKQMLRIFMDNAVKYTPAGGRITLSCRSDGQTVRYQIVDSGIGIPKEEIPRVFERFYRVEQSRAKETGGSGLGLSIAQYIAKGNNASITLESELHKGTTITVSFPVKMQNSAKEEEPVCPAED